MYVIYIILACTYSVCIAIGVTREPHDSKTEDNSLLGYGTM